MRVDWSREPGARGDRRRTMSDPMYYFLSGQKMVSWATRSARTKTRSSTRTARSSRATTSTSRHKEIRARPTSWPATGCSAPTTRSDRGAAAPAEITFRNSLLPVPEVSEYEPLAFPDRELIRRTDGKPLRMAFGRQRNHSVHRGRAEGERADRRRLHRSVARPVREVRLLPDRAPGLRPAGRRDAGGAPVLHQPLEHLAGDDPEGRRRQAAAGHAGELRCACRCRRARRGPSRTT